jgi:hypothetical protein
MTMVVRNVPTSSMRRSQLSASPIGVTRLGTAECRRGHKMLGAEDGAQLVALSPDGKRIAFYSTRTGNRDIYTMDVDGGSPEHVTALPGQERFPPDRPTERVSPLLRPQRVARMCPSSRARRTASGRAGATDDDRGGLSGVHLLTTHLAGFAARHGRPLGRAVRSRRALRMDRAIARPKSGGTALPIWVAMLFPRNTKLPGNDWRAAASR